MKKVGSFLCFIILCASPAFAKQCFIVKEKGEPPRVYTRGI
jgi:hypothetical protein